MALRSYLHSTFDPRRVPGLQAWYDAADSASITLNSGRVSQWSDKSGNARHATNTTSGSTQPSYTAAGRNGLNVLSFAAASVQRLSVPSSTATFKFLHDGTPCWWVAVTSYGASSNPNTAYVTFATNSGSSQSGVYYIFEDRSAIGGNDGGVFGVANGSGIVADAYSVTGYTGSTNNIITPQTATIQEMLVDVANATAANRAILRINGGSGITFNTYLATPSSAASQTNFTIGALNNGALPLQGELYELMFFNQHPTAAARDLIRRYLGAKWGVTVA